MSDAEQRTQSSPVRTTLMRMNVIGEAPDFVRCCEAIDRFAQCDVAILIEGETGTGKELFARAAHYLGPRADCPFVPVNCGAMPSDLFENELFGHSAGAFTGATRGNAGLIHEADRGTLFLDEVDAMSPHAQVSLLRFLEDHEYRRLGDAKLRRSTARIITASNRELAELVEERHFRRDLYFRLNLLTITLPPLRDRRGDVMLLSRHFLDKYTARYDCTGLTLDPGTLDWMTSYSWPGNVRELENLIHRGVLLSDDSNIVIERPDDRSTPQEGLVVTDDLIDRSFSKAKAETIEAFERRYLTQLMRRTGGNITQAARYAGKERSALGKLIKKHQIDRSRFRHDDPHRDG